MRKRTPRRHQEFDELHTLGRDHVAPTRPMPTPPHERRPVVDARTDRHHMRELLHDAERGGEHDELIA